MLETNASTTPNPPNARTKQCPVCHKKIKHQHHKALVKYHKTTYCSNDCFNHI